MNRDWVLIEGDGLIHWPMCKTPGCGNRMNRAAGNGYCWPCQPSGKSFHEVLESVGSGSTVTADKP